MTATDACFHCALPIPANYDCTVEIEGQRRAVCCPGCKAVAELIRDSGMGNYYVMRDAPQPGSGRPNEERAEWNAFNSEEMLQTFSDVDGPNAEASIFAGGMYCSACSWLIETSLTNLGGVKSVEVNPMTHRVRVRWNPAELGLGDLLASLASLGYRPQPLAPGDDSRPEVEEQRQALKRLLVASLGMMQVMMFAVGLYAGDFQGIDADMQYFLRLVSFFVATPVVFYAARPFFASAWRGLITRMPGMDLPVSIAIGAAYAASVYATFTQGQAVWFDSVAMFVFFLTLGRYLEMRARHRSIDRSAALSQILPNTTTVVVGDEKHIVPVSNLKPDDIVLLRAGDSIPADGTIIRGSTSVDEALLTGEARPQARQCGDSVSAGSVNIDGLIEMRVVKTGRDTALGAISRLSERARYTRPEFVKIADRIASRIVVALLLIAAAVASFWYFTAPEKAFVITLSVLVVTCPCALALATPAAFATAGSRMSQLQLLLTNGDAIEILSKVTRVVFDKTGTLTLGQPEIESVTVFDSNYSDADCLQIAAALEQASSHPIALAFREFQSTMQVDRAEVHVAEGVSGVINQQPWQLGKAGFAVPDSDIDSSGAIYLSTGDHCVASFHLRDQLRPGTRETIDALRELDVSLSLASGDHQQSVENIAQTLGIEDVAFECTPGDKLKLIETLQQRGERVVMIGDGINDAPVLAGADASIAPGHGATLAQTHADIIMLGTALQPVATAVRLSRRTMRIVRQNLYWAIGYNVTALPLAVAGFVPPWLAAIGMSASSLVVVLNALRLNRFT